MEKKRRILHLTYDMGVGGTEQVITQLVRNLDSGVYENRIACTDGQVGLLGEALQQQGYEFEIFSRQPGFDRELIKSIRAVLNRDQIDIIHCHQYTPFVYGVLAALFTRTKVVFTEHGRFHPDSYTWKRRLINPVLGWCTDSIVAISKATADALAHYEWFSARSIQVVYNGIQPPVDHCDETIAAELGLDASHLVFGTIARFDTIKNLPMMINGFKEVRQKNSAARLLLVGDGDERGALEAHVAELGLTDSVIFTGYQKQTAKYMSLIDIYLLTSFSEGTSMTLLEAMAMRVCSIVTRVGGNVEIVEHEVSGIVVESDDVDDLAGWMLRLDEDAVTRERLAAAGQKVFAEKFSVQTMAVKYSEIYSRLLRRL